MREYKHSLRRMVLKTSAQLESVRDELNERQKKDVNDLSYLLSRADTLTAYIEEETRAESDKADVYVPWIDCGTHRIKSYFIL